MTWRASVLTLFPAMFPGPVGQSLAGRALETGARSIGTSSQSYPGTYSWCRRLQQVDQRPALRTCRAICTPVAP